MFILGRAFHRSACVVPMPFQDLAEVPCESHLRDAGTEIRWKMIVVEVKVSVSTLVHSFFTLRIP